MHFGPLIGLGGPNFQPTTSGYQLWHHGTIYMVPLAPCREKILSVEVILLLNFLWYEGSLKCVLHFTYLHKAVTCCISHVIIHGILVPCQAPRYIGLRCRAIVSTISAKKHFSLISITPSWIPFRFPRAAKGIHWCNIIL